jgi:hypothetical protein
MIELPWFHTIPSPADIILRPRLRRCPSEFRQSPDDDDDFSMAVM